MAGRRRPDLKEKAIRLRIENRLGRNKIAQVLDSQVSPITVGRWLRDYPLTEIESKAIRKAGKANQKVRSDRKPRINCEVCGIECGRNAKRFCASCALKQTGGHNRLPLSDYLVENRLVSSTRLKQRLIREGYLEKQCSECGLGPEWNGKPLVLQLDHIDGNRKNNLIENLRIVCPNCHTQTETYAAKNRKNPKRAKRVSRYLNA